MQVRAISTLSELVELEGAWRALAGERPFLSPCWLGTWWHHFGEPAGRRGRELSVLAVSDGGDLVGLAPWYAEHSLWQGRTLRFLGSGEVCSEYLTVPCLRGYEKRVAGAIAKWLCDAEADESTGRAWDSLSLEGVADDDLLVRELSEALAARGALVDTRSAPNCWRLELPATWNEFVAQLSRPRRKRVRQLERDYFDRGFARLVTAETPEQWSRGFQIWVYLHEKRWAARGQRGIFAQDGILNFHCDATEQLLESGLLWLTWLELDGRPIAADYSLAGDAVVYRYQSGIDPDVAEHKPGTLALVALLRGAIERGCRSIDFLRGNEPYKAAWGAEPRPTLDVRVLPGDWSGRLRQTMRQTAADAKSWLRAGRDAMFAATRGGRDAD